MTKRERPILFSGPMVRAILDGTKTQTRRIVKPQPTSKKCSPTLRATNPEGLVVWKGNIQDIQTIVSDNPFGKPGDRLWVRETFAVADLDWRGINGRLTDEHKKCRKTYRATWDDDAANGLKAAHELRWRPSIHMPRWASRLTLEIVDVRLERVQEITTGDAWAEGCPADVNAIDLFFKPLWESVYPGSWEKNDWVWVVTFRRVRE